MNNDPFEELYGDSITSFSNEVESENQQEQVRKVIFQREYADPKQDKKIDTRTYLSKLKHKPDEVAKAREEAKEKKKAYQKEYQAIYRISNKEKLNALSACFRNRKKQKKTKRP